MSSNSSPRAAIRAFALVGLAAALAGCASGLTGGGASKLAEQARTPTELYTLKAQSQPDQVLLAVHPDGLSPAQDEALRGLAERWREDGGHVIQISAPRGQIDARTVYIAVQAARDRLISLGVPEADISLQGYEAGSDPAPPLKVEFTRYEAVVPACGQSWDNLSATGENEVQSNFGCALTANMAAQIANPADIVAPRASAPADGGRLATVIDGYRKNQTPSNGSGATAGSSGASGSSSGAGSSSQTSPSS